MRIDSLKIDREAAKIFDELGCVSCFKGYRAGGLPPFPSHTCLSVNDCVVHGTAGSHLEPLVEGDLLKIDVGVLRNGWIGDAAWSYAIGSATDEQLRLMEASKACLAEGIPMLHPDQRYIAWAKTVHEIAERRFPFHMVRGLGGHGYGKKLHAPPFVSNTVPTFPGEWPEAFEPCRPGTLVAVEPMLAVGTGKTVQAKRQWPIRSADGSMTVHHEADVLITESGPRNLTEGMAEELPDVVGV
ncbi:MAG: M24 family metallopeptidase [Planctomycetota bacterium]